MSATPPGGAACRLRDTYRLGWTHGTPGADHAGDCNDSPGQYRGPGPPGLDAGSLTYWYGRASPYFAAHQAVGESDSHIRRAVSYPDPLADLPAPPRRRS